ncbi:MAG: hypothetical protein FD176_1113 [Rhodospirillaceae bacterium]|nr:MAG: hypothetical protein FD176_1113 [Rhodospirillaceae bacterium]TNC97212.1 MAG: hypothetical protein FD119_1304 [Stygiobacter sp.]
MTRLTTHGAVSTATASRYLIQLCKHFAHKIPVEYGDTTGRADFPGGSCHFSADDSTLSLRLEAESDQSLQHIKAVVEDHLVRFGWRETLNIAWESR